LRVPKKFHGKVDPLIGVNFTVKDIIINDATDERMLTIILLSKNTTQTNSANLKTSLSKK